MEPHLLIVAAHLDLTLPLTNQRTPNLKTIVKFSHVERCLRRASSTCWNSGVWRSAWDRHPAPVTVLIGALVPAPFVALTPASWEGPVLACGQAWLGVTGGDSSLVALLWLGPRTHPGLHFTAFVQLFWKNLREILRRTPFVGSRKHGGLLSFSGLKM